MPETPLFSILIPTWNNLRYLQLCVDSIRKYSTHRHQIIVHANESKDGTVDWLRQQPDVDFTYSEDNIGICYALNLSSTLVKTDYVLYINDDMFVCPGWDQALLEEVQKIGHRRFFLSSTAIEPASQNNCTIKADFGRTIDSFDEEALIRDFASFPISDWQGSTWPPNLVHRETWDLVGGYSVEFSPGMYSDPDFSMKLWQAGVRYFKGVARSRVYHFGKISTKRVKTNKGYNQFIRKWGITSSTLTEHVLRRGQPFTGPLPEFKPPFWLRIKNLLKKIAVSFNKE
ncbi:MAG: glycosyltransferase [Flavihumibacter sp.]